MVKQSLGHPMLAADHAPLDQIRPAGGDSPVVCLGVLPTPPDGHSGPGCPPEPTFLTPTLEMELA